jgi:hypothetical protein
MTINIIRYYKCRDSDGTMAGRTGVEGWSCGGPKRSYCLLFRKLAFVDVELA